MARTRKRIAESANRLRQSHDVLTATRHCPSCSQAMTFHNSRPERGVTGEYERVDVYFCIHHGFFHSRNHRMLSPGM